MISDHYSRRSTRKHCSLFQFAVSITIAIIFSSTRAVAALAAATARDITASSSYHYHRTCFSSRRRQDGVISRTATKMAAETRPSRDDGQLVLESPSAERNKGPIYDRLLAPIVFPRLTDHANAKNDDNGGGGDDTIKVLELAAGCGVHTTHFVSSFLSANEEGGEQRRSSSRSYGVEWHPSDPDAEARCSIDARVRREGLDAHVVKSNGWILGRSGGTACGDGNRDGGDAGIASLRRSGSGTGVVEGNNDANYERHEDSFDLALCINMIHIAPWEATLGLVECCGRVLRRGGMLVCYGPYKVGGTAVESNLRFDGSLRSRNPDWGVRNLEDVVDAAKREGLEFVLKEEMPANNLGVIFRKT